MCKKNKLLFVNLTTYSRVGGIENYNKNIINACDNLDVVSIYDNKSPENECVNFYNFNGNKLRASLFIICNAKKYKQILASHINLLTVLFLAKIANPKLEIFMSVHGIEVWKKFSLIKRYFLKHIVILPVSNYTKEIMICKNNLNSNLYRILYNSIQKNAPLVLRKANKNEYFNILSVSRLNTNDNYKGVDKTLIAVSKLVKIIPNLKYTIIGKGNDKDRLVALSKKLEIEKNVIFEGYIKNIENYYNDCDVFVLPSSGEGFGIVYIEAMKYKKPCIACSEGGQTDVVLDGETGYLCDYGDTECLSNKILDLYKNSDKRKEFGEKGYNHFIENFTFEKFEERLKEVLNAGF